MRRPFVVADPTALIEHFVPRIDSSDGRFFGLSQQEHSSVLFSSAARDPPPWTHAGSFRSRWQHRVAVDEGLHRFRPGVERPLRPSFSQKKKDPQAAPTAKTARSGRSRALKRAASSKLTEVLRRYSCDLVSSLRRSVLKP
jgi:hypothetical protein